MNESIYILLGTNLGERPKHLYWSLELLAKVKGVRIIRVSGIYNSPAMEMNEPSPEFLNQAVEINCTLSPNELLQELKAIEVKMGRTHKGNYQSRIIDLDILLYGRQIIETDELTVPQKGLLKRPFAIIPLIEIAPDIIHPVSKTRFSDCVAESDYKFVTPFEEHAPTSR